MLHAHVSRAGLQGSVLWLPGSAFTLNGLEAAAYAGKKDLYSNAHFVLDLEAAAGGPERQLVASRSCVC